MLNELGLGNKGNYAVIIFFKRKFASKSNKITSNAFIKLILSFVECCTFN